MTTGLGFGEILLVLFVVVMFFGSKELPRFIREIASLMAKARRYTEKVRRELDELSRPVRDELEPRADSSAIRKKKLRKECRTKLDVLTDEERSDMSRGAISRLSQTEEFQRAPAIMIYVSTANEVGTHDFIRECLETGKRVVVPYCREGSNRLGVGEIRDFDRDLREGMYGIPEPLAEKRDNFFKSDIRLVICPGLAFDREGGRLGHGKGYYDSFLSEMKGTVPVFGLAFGAQILHDPVPFDYHDVPMDQIVTESGLVISKPQEGISPTLDEGERPPTADQAAEPETEDA